jgi:ribonuclease E
MSKKMLIDATHPEETRVVVVDGTKVEEFDFESINKRQLAGNIYLAKVTRVEPSLQAAFVEYGGNRHGFLAFSEIHPDYYQIPVADREALLAAEAAADAAEDRDEDDGRNRKRRDAGRTRDRRRDGGRAARAPGSGGDAAAGRDAGTPAAAGADAAPAAGGSIPVEPIPVEPVAGEPVVVESAAVESTAEDAVQAAAPEPAGVADDAPTDRVAQDGADAAPAPAGAGSAGAAQAADEQAADEDAGAPAPSQDAADDGAAPRPPSAMAESAGTDEAETVSEEYPAADAPSDGPADPAAEAPAAPAEDADAAPAVAGGETDADGKPRRSRRGRRRRAPREGEGEDSAPESAVADAPAEAPARADAEVETVADAAAEETVESVGAESVEDEVRPRRIRARSYKIQEVIKVRQIMLVQVVKEERGNKGAALTTYLSLAGRYCVLMPNTARGGGISRKITSAEDRKKLKEIAAEFEIPRGMGLIIRTAGAQRTRAEIKRDYEFLLRQWEQVRELTLKSIAPTLIYEEGSLIKRSIRDLYSKDIEEILVEGDEGYREAKDYMRMLTPSHAKAVQPYKDPTPLFIRHQVESYLASMFNPTVQLKSGGYIVIGITEALVAIDVNSGRSTREGSIEETALKTNLEAADEVARQLRLRDLAGLIVIDFIDMDERRNNAAVEKRMKERLKNDRARIQMGRISAFGLMELSRQRLRPGMLEASTAPCAHCHGTGLVRSGDSLALSILREVEEEGVKRRSREIKVVAPVSVANYILNQKREHVAAIEARYGMSVVVEGDPSLVSPDHRLEKAKIASRPVPETPVAAITASATYAALEDPRDVDDAEADGAAAGPVATPESLGGGGRRRSEDGARRAEARRDEGRREEARRDVPAREAAPRDETPRPDDAAGDDGAPKAKRRRGKRGGKKRRREGEGEAEAGAPAKGMEIVDFDDDEDDAEPAAAPEPEVGAPPVDDGEVDGAVDPEIEAMAAPPAGPASPPVDAEAAPPTAAWESPLPTADGAAPPAAPQPVAFEPASAEPARSEPAPAPSEAAAPASDPAPAAVAEPEAPPRPKRGGWWSAR